MLKKIETKHPAKKRKAKPLAAFSSLFYFSFPLAPTMGYSQMKQSVFSSLPLPRRAQMSHQPAKSMKNKH